MKTTNVFLHLFFIFIAMTGFAQTGIGTTTPSASAKLEVAATDKGFLPPRVALTATNVFTPITGTAASAAGLLIYNTATAGSAPNNVVPGYYYWNGSAWNSTACRSWRNCDHHALCSKSRRQRSIGSSWYRNFCCSLYYRIDLHVFNKNSCTY